MREARSVFSQAMPIMRMSCENNNNNNNNSPLPPSLKSFDTTLIGDGANVSRQNARQQRPERDKSHGTFALHSRSTWFFNCGRKFSLFFYRLDPGAVLPFLSARR